MPAEPSAPGATYRLQLQPRFGFDDVAAIVTYLAELGVTHVFVTPPPAGTNPAAFAAVLSDLAHGLHGERVLAKE